MENSVAKKLYSVEAAIMIRNIVATSEEDAIKQAQIKLQDIPYTASKYNFAAYEEVF